MKDKNIKNMEKCPSFQKCSQNFCPLDSKINLRVGSEQDKCRWMRNPTKKKIGRREFISGGRQMPSAILENVPESNLRWLNGPSKKSWLKINRKK
jgi:hypothetical protein